MAKVELKFVGEGSLVFTLYHTSYCEKVGGCECTIKKELRAHTSKTGETGSQYTKIVNPRSVYLNKGDVVELDSCILAYPQVANAQKTGELEVQVLSVKSQDNPAESQEPTSEGFARRAKKL